MDIDEFLDKEIKARKEEVEEKPIANQDTKEEKDAIEHYFELWSKISETKFKWDSNLYEELDKEGNKVKEKLSRLSQAMERKKNAIKRLIGKALNELENKNYGAATKLYSEISDMRKSFPDFLLEQKKELNREILLLYEKLHDQIDSKFINDLKDSIAKIDALITDSYSSFDSGDVDKAKVFYEKALGLYKDLPNGFLSRKIELGIRLLALYKDLSIHTEIKTLQQQLVKKSIRGYGYTKSYEKLESLSGMMKNRNLWKAELSPFSGSAGRKTHTIHEKTLLPRLIARKLDRARINLKKGTYFEARKNLESVLSVDPENEEAKQMLSEIPVEY
jgi:tetratricopeptide (TPR) repeat protein